ncbi:MAG: restriction endonuclease [Gammaproteobacteria bacterium]|nr:restriction endonuclease [Gammaproteobacteria bacterium]MDE0251574.1 restriction endonuclease [Gammaproteobacteria bacterium]MDE0403416.1 restriction endonuclease [Gammaproteobacteria bacterium]
MSSHIVEIYNNRMSKLFDETEGGKIRSQKGKLVEDLAREMILEAWKRTGNDENRLEFKSKKFKVRPRSDVRSKDLELLRSVENIDSLFYRLGVDIHTFIDGEFCLGVECKAYTENAMLKRILVDFWLLKKLYPGLNCCLVQLETFLGGSYDANEDCHIANSSTYTLVSHFPEVDLGIYTLLAGSRAIKQPIHQREFAKSMEVDIVESVIESLKTRLLKTVDSRTNG